MKSKAKTILGLILGVVITATPQAFADTDLTTELLSDIQPSISVAARTIKNEESVNAASGIHGGLIGEFDLETNNNTNFVMTAVIKTQEGDADGFANDGKVLMFTNLDYLPNKTAVDNAKNHTGLSPNVIAYPFTLKIDEPMTLHWQPNNSQNKPRWAIYANTGTSAKLTQTIAGVPYNDTYERGVDAKGQYQVTVYVTVMEQ